MLILLSVAFLGDVVGTPLLFLSSLVFDGGGIRLCICISTFSTCSGSATFLFVVDIDLVSTVGGGFAFFGSGDPVARPKNLLNADVALLFSSFSLASTASIMTIAFAAADIDAGATAALDSGYGRGDGVDLVPGIRESDVLLP